MDEETVRYYNEHAQDVAERYESAGSGVSSFFPFVFSAGERVLDIGCGSGRDLSVLRKLGVDAFGLEPSEGLRAQAVTMHPELRNRIFAGSLPGEASSLGEQKFNGVLLAAVIMHIPHAELFDFAFAIRDLLVDGGTLLVSFSTARGDLQPEGTGQERDTRGRLMIVRSPSRVRLLFERLGFVVTNEYNSADAAARNDVRWTSLVFRYTGAVPRPVDRLESILNADRKVATYKLALIRAFCDLALTGYNTVHWTRGGKVAVPLASVADLWIRYYWPLFASRQLIPQINGESKGAKPVGFRKVVTELVDHFRKLGGLDGFDAESRKGSLHPEAKRLYHAARTKVGTTIVNGPVRYSGGAMERREFEFDTEQRTILIDAEFWREVVLMAHWVQDAVIVRWAEMTARLSKGDSAVSVGGVLELLLSTAEALRMDQAIRGIYEAKLPLECVWTAKNLTSSFDVDHALPFALWQDSSSWNLFPAAKSVNNQKRDKLPSLALLRQRKEVIVSYWELLFSAAPNRFAHESQKLGGAQFSVTDGNWQNSLFSTFVEAIEYTATSRGVPRWEP